MTSPEDSLLGIQLDEYRIEAPLGYGGMARVYRALDTQLQRPVALKVIASDFRGNDDYHARFVREAQSIARLEHPNIVRIYRLGEARGLYYIVMKYVEGTDLAHLIDHYRRHNELLPVEDVVRYVEEIGSALDYAHAQNVIHRDVKPSNIIIDQGGHAILTDFGLVFLPDSANRDPVLGSPQYMAPEQAVVSGTVVPQSDIYSLGVTLFEMLTGYLPFTSDEPLDLAMLHFSEPPPPPSSFNPAIPPVIDAVVLRCLEKDPQKRYQTGAELGAALKQGVETWMTDSARVTQRTRLPFGNMANVRQKLNQLIKPDPPPDLHFAPGESASSANTLPQTVRGAPNPPGQPPPDPPRIPPAPGASRPAAPPGPLWPSGQSAIWLYLVGLAAILLVCVCLSALAILVFRGTGSPAAAFSASTTAPTVTPLFIPAPITVSPVLNATPLPTAEVRTAVPSGVQPPGELPTVPLPPTPTAMAVLPPLPQNRDAAPPGSQRLGEFAVEWYCNNQGLGVKLINDQADWACTNADGSIRFVLGPADFDNICRITYKNAAAFAIRDQKKPIQAYNWSCYEYFAAPTAASPAG